MNNWFLMSSEECDIITCGSDLFLCVFFFVFFFFRAFSSCCFFVSPRWKRRPGVLVLINDTDWDLVSRNSVSFFLFFFFFCGCE